MLISIIVPAHIYSPEFHCCLHSINLASTNYNPEVIIVLDGIKHESSFFSDLEYSNYNFVEIEQKNGPAYARNHGAEHAKGEVLLFIDSDVTISAETIQELYKHYSTPQAEEAVIGSYDDSPGDYSLISKYRNLLHHFTHQTASTKASTFWGACGAIKKNHI